MKYRCLVLDHDDTVVDSTASIHHPCFQEFLNLIRPGKKISLEEYFSKNFGQNFLDFCRSEYGFTDEVVQDACNRTLLATSRPSFEYADKILTEWHRQGVSHSLVVFLKIIFVDV